MRAINTDVTESIGRHFARMGASVRFSEVPGIRAGNGISVGLEGRPGSRRFEITLPGEDIELRVLDARPRERHLLLLSRLPDGEAHRYLCGHDERDWFVAAVTRGSSVADAREALKPAQVHLEQRRVGIKSKERSRRKTRAYLRQGEWFFVPRPELAPEASVVLRNEPIRRGRGTPHLCECLVRQGGELVYVSPRRPNGVTQEEYEGLLRQNPDLARLPWQVRMRGARVYVKGRISHPDHRSLVLRSWHEVLMNTEHLAPHMEFVTFLD